ncbi:MAG TPA: glycoside hydrolase family 2 TIM barrel-domain containing protein [Spirochaetota bacterium]
MAQPFQLGINYWPRRKGMGWWADFDRREVADEFALIRSFGMSLVRIFLLWDDFQDDPEKVSMSSVNNLTTVCDIAKDNSLTLDVTFFTGHMSGPNWAPRWSLIGKPLPGARKLVSAGTMIESGYRNPFTDPMMIAAEKVLITEVVTRLKDHPAIAIWNLGNEPDLFARPPDAATGQLWVRTMTQLIKSIDAVHPVTCGLHAASLTEDNGFRVDQVFSETDLAVMHAYPMYSGWSRGPLDPDLVPFTCALVTALCGKPTLMEEFGGCTNPGGEESAVWKWTMYGEEREQFMAGEDDFADYIGKVLPKLVDVGASGALLWCFADYDQSIWNVPPCDEVRHERHFGLVRPDGSIKPHAYVIRDFAQTNPVVKENARRAPLSVNPDEFYRDPERYVVEAYEKYLEL